MIYIHISAADLEKLRPEGKGNLIVTEHIASDSLGINLLHSRVRENGVSVTRIGIVEG